MKYFRHYLLGRPFIVRTDHAALQWLRRIPEPIGKQARWIGMLEEFAYIIVHRAGTKHGNADAMSRRPCDRARCCPKEKATNEIGMCGTLVLEDEPNTRRQPQEERPWLIDAVPIEQEADLDIGPIY
jgi:hypothetical protein